MNAKLTDLELQLADLRSKLDYLREITPGKGNRGKLIQTDKNYFFEILKKQYGT